MLTVQRSRARLTTRLRLRKGGDFYAADSGQGFATGLPMNVPLSQRPADSRGVKEAASFQPLTPHRAQRQISPVGARHTAAWPNICAPPAQPVVGSWKHAAPFFLASEASSLTSEGTLLVCKRIPQPAETPPQPAELPPPAKRFFFGQSTVRGQRCQEMGAYDIYQCSSRDFEKDGGGGGGCRPRSGSCCSMSLKGAGQSARMAGIKYAIFPLTTHHSSPITSRDVAADTSQPPTR
jgi:hypothetical protein